jgi:glycine betaine/proline transport system ATP-binding protein
MEEIGDTSDFSELTVTKNAIIKTVAEAVLNEPKPVAVVDDNNEMIGVLNSKTIIHILFGESSAASLSAN